MGNLCDILLGNIIIKTVDISFDAHYAFISEITFLRYTHII